MVPPEPKDYVIVLALLWFSVRALREPRDRALRVVVVLLTGQLLGEEVTIHALHAWGVVSVPVGKTLQNCGLAASFYGLMLFFLMSAAGFRTREQAQAAPNARRRAKIELAVLLTVILILIVAVATTPPELQNSAYPMDGELQDAALYRPEVATFYVTALIYFGYGALCAGWWALRYAAESSTRARWGLRLMALGMAFFGVACGGRGLFTLLRITGVEVPEILTIVATEFVDLAAISYIVGALSVGLAARLAALRIWLQRRQEYDEMRPLWIALHKAFPDDVLDRHRPEGLWRDRLSPSQVHRRHWRRCIEIRDGLVRLSPHLVDAGWDDTAPAPEKAAMLRGALQQRQDGVAPQSQTAVRVLAPPAEHTIDDDVRELTALSRAFARLA